jgi:hypothetical protein
VTLSTTAVDFGTKRVATPSAAQEIILTNSGGAVLTLSDMALKGPKDFDLFTNCVGTAARGGTARRLAPGSSCKIFAVFTAASSGVRSGVISVQDDAPGGTQMISLTGTGTQGYYVAGAAGEVIPSGDAIPFGAAASLKLSAPVVGLAAAPDVDGYWLLGRDGGIFAYGSATFRGSAGGMHLNRLVVGMAATPSGLGYWLVASDGGIFAFGDAGFYGSTGKITLNTPIVGMAATPSGAGYWLVASDGGIFAFGDAPFLGPMSGQNDIIGLSPTSRPLPARLLTAP